MQPGAWDEISRLVGHLWSCQTGPLGLYFALCECVSAITCSWFTLLSQHYSGSILMSCPPATRILWPGCALFFFYWQQCRPSLMVPWHKMKLTHAHTSTCHLLWVICGTDRSVHEVEHITDAKFTFTTSTLKCHYDSSDHAAMCLSNLNTTLSHASGISPIQINKLSLARLTGVRMPGVCGLCENNIYIA